jgi:DNA polymerase/3'-5' exonuclease PolX
MNIQIINQFKSLINQIKHDIDNGPKNKQMGNMYRLKSTRTVLDIIKNFKTKIISSNQLKDIKGIGKKSLARIDEILQTGKLEEITNTKDVEKYNESMSELEDVIGIGRRKAYDLIKNYNIFSIEQLKNAYENKTIELSDVIVKGLKYYGKIKENIPRNEIDKLYNIIIRLCYQIHPKLLCIICGSYRRQQTTSNDVDIVLVHTDLITKKDILKINYLEKFVSKMKSENIITESLTGEHVNSKYMGIYKLNKDYRRIDIRYVPYESFYTAILYFTGPKEFNKKMRNIAISLGYKLNEYGLYDKNNKMFKIIKEQDVFNKLNMSYLNPHER